MRQLAVDHLVAPNVTIDMHCGSMLNATADVVPAQIRNFAKIVGRHPQVARLSSHPYENGFLGHVRLPRKIDPSLDAATALSRRRRACVCDRC